MRLGRILATSAFAAFALTGALRPTAAIAAPIPAADKSWLVAWVERKISTPDRRITLGEIDGALSSDVTISSITVADRQGIWLTITGAHLIWTRSALLTGELSITTLEAKEIVVARAPVGSATLSATANDDPVVPELPVSISLGKLSAPRISLPASIVGTDTVLSVEASGTYDNEKLHAKAKASRLDAIGGTFLVQTDYETRTAGLSLDLDYREPRGGVVAKALSIPGEPALAFHVKGAGPLDGFAADIGLEANDAPLVAGRATVSHGAEGYAFQLDVNGSLESLAVKDGADFLRGGTQIALKARQVKAGGFVLDRAHVKSGALTLDGSGIFAGDGFPTALKLSGAVVSGAGQPLRLPGTTSTLRAGKLDLAFGDGTWRGTTELTQFRAAAGEVGSATLTASGQASNLADAARRATTFAILGAADGVKAASPALARALEDQLTFRLDGSWTAGKPIEITLAEAANRAVKARFIGAIDGFRVTGDWQVASTDLSELSGLAGTDLTGRATLAARGEVTALTGGFRLAISGESDAVEAGPAALSALTAAKTVLGGEISRDADGLHLTSLRLANGLAAISLEGTIGDATTSLAADARLADLRRLTDRGEGPLHLVATLSGPNAALDYRAEVTSPLLTLQGQAWTRAAITATGTLRGDAVDGDIALGGTLYGKPLVGKTHFAYAGDGRRQLSGLDLAVGDARIRADLAMAASGLVAGNLMADIPKLEQLAPLLLVRATGAARLSADLGDAGQRQTARIAANVSGVMVESLTIGSGAIDLQGADLTTSPAIAGLVDLKALSFGSFSVSSATTRLQLVGTATKFDSSLVTSEGPVTTSGTLSPVNGGFDIRLAALKATLRGRPITLQDPVTLAKRAAGVTIPKAVLALPDAGRLTIDGTVGETLALDIAATRVPLSLADLARKDLGAAGTLSGTVRLTGTRARPTATFSMRGEGLSVQAIRGTGLPPLTLVATGEGDLKAVKLDARLTGGQGTTVTARGTIPLSGDGLAVQVVGSSSLALINPLLRDRATTATGAVRADVTITGALARPQARGTVTVAEGTLNDPITGNRLSGLVARLRLDGDRLTLERVAATTGKSGSLTVQGSVTLTPDLAASLTATLDRASLVDADLVRAIVSGRLAISGPLLSRPRIAGALVINRADLTIPERLASNVALLGVRDSKASAAVKRTNALAARTTGKRRARGPAFDAVVDIRVSADSMIFVRGRGLDAELSGAVQLTGPASAIVPVGSFKLRRGSIDVIGRHITLDRGEVTLTGNFDPTIDFVASARSSSIAVTASVTGEVSDPRLVLASTPDLPQDEVLAQFLFGHSIADLTPLQLVQLAAAAAQLAGGSSGEGLLASIRASTGLDSLGTTTDSTGNVALQAGRYINERVYLGVTAGASGQTEGTINLDVTPGIKLQGQLGTDGSKVGIIYQHDY